MARPDAPANVLATKGDPSEVITWDAVVGALTYTIYRSPVEGDAGYVIGMADTATFTDSTALANVIYWYGVTASADRACSVLSQQDYGYVYPGPTPQPPPDAPPDFMVTVN